MGGILKLAKGFGKTGSKTAKATTTLNRDKKAADFVKKFDKSRGKTVTYEEFYEPAAAKAKREGKAILKKAKKSSFVKGVVVGGGAAAIANALTKKEPSAKKKTKRALKPKVKYKF
jgi:cysteine synthase